jgi:hypothetical protein
MPFGWVFVMGHCRNGIIRKLQLDNPPFDSNVATGMEAGKRKLNLHSSGR